MSEWNECCDSPNEHRLHMELEKYKEALLEIGHLTITNDSGRFGLIMNAMEVAKILKRVGIG